MNPTRNAFTRARSTFHGWRVLGLMLGTRAGGAGVVQFGNSLFVLPLEQALGINRGLTSLLFASGAFVASGTAPFSGALMDCFGPRKVLLWSLLLTAGGFVAFSQARSVAVVFIVYLGPISLGIMNITYNASSAIINNWFERYKATAMALLQVGTAFGGLIVVPILAVAIATWGWRAAAIVAAAIVLAAGLPAALFSKDTPEELGLTPDGTPAVPSTPRQAAATAPPLTGPTVGEAFRTRTFWMLAGAAFFIGATLTAVQIHFVPILVWKGMSEVSAALVFTVWAFLSIPCVIAAGWAGDRYRRLTVAFVVVLSTGSGIALLNVGGTSWTLWVAVLLISSSAALYPLMWATAGEAFGRRAYSTIRGSIMALQIGGILGMPVLTGYVFDWTGAYTVPLWMASGFTVMSAFFMVLTPRRREAAAVTTLGSVRSALAQPDPDSV